MTDTATAETCSESAITHVSAHLRFWIPSILVLWLDLWSKHKIFSTLLPEQSIPLMGRVLEFRRSMNDGAVFGTFTGYAGLFIVASLVALGFVLYLFAGSHRSQRSLHIALALVLAGALGNLYDRSFIIADVAIVTTESNVERSFIGTLVDDSSEEFIRIGDWPDGANPRTLNRSEIQLKRQGVVRDFIHVLPRFPSWFPLLADIELWPWVFNVADASLVIGVAMLLLQSWFARRKRVMTQS